jgi:hypothetical protein
VRGVDVDPPPKEVCGRVCGIEVRDEWLTEKGFALGGNRRPGLFGLRSELGFILFRSTSDEKEGGKKNRADAASPSLYHRSLRIEQSDGMVAIVPQASGLYNMREG